MRYKQQLRYRMMILLECLEKQSCFKQIFIRNIREYFKKQCPREMIELILLNDILLLYY